MKKLWQIITTPFRLGVEFVDGRPSISQVRRHLGQVQPVIRRNGPDTEVHLQLIGASGVETECLKAIEAGGDMALARAYADGVVDGWGLCVKRVQILKRTTIARQNRVVLKARRQKVGQVVERPALPSC